MGVPENPGSRYALHLPMPASPCAAVHQRVQGLRIGPGNAQPFRCGKPNPGVRIEIQKPGGLLCVRSEAPTGRGEASCE